MANIKLLMRGSVKGITILIMIICSPLLCSCTSGNSGFSGIYGNYAAGAVMKSGMESGIDLIFDSANVLTMKSSGVDYDIFEYMNDDDHIQVLKLVKEGNSNLVTSANPSSHQIFKIQVGTIYNPAQTLSKNPNFSYKNTSCLCRDAELSTETGKGKILSETVSLCQNGLKQWVYR